MGGVGGAVAEVVADGEVAVGEAFDEGDGFGGFGLWGGGGGEGEGAEVLDCEELVAFGTTHVGFGVCDRL